MRKVLILTRNFPPYVTGGASRAWQFATNFAAIGWEPVVVAPPAITGMAAGVKSGANPVNEVYRTAPDIDAGGLDAAARLALLHGQEVPGMNRPFKGRKTRQFRSISDGSHWLKSAAATVEQLLENDPEIDLLYAQGPPLEPLQLALEVARNHSLNLMLDITAPLDPAMPKPGASRSAAAKAERQILLSGVPLLTPNRFLKEYFLKKYPDKLGNGLITIVSPAFDPSHPAFRRQESKTHGTVLRIALHLEALSKRELNALVAGLEAWIRADGIMSGSLELMLLGVGAPELLRRTVKKPLQKLFVIDETGGIDRELEQCRSVDLFCAVLGNSTATASITPDRLIDALGIGVPLCLVAPEGVASQLVAECGGMVAPPGDAGAIMELFRAMASASSFGNLQCAPDWLRQKHEITAVMRELRGAIASQPLR